MVAALKGVYDFPWSFSPCLSVPGFSMSIQSHARPEPFHSSARDEFRKGHLLAIHALVENARSRLWPSILSRVNNFENRLIANVVEGLQASLVAREGLLLPSKGRAGDVILLSDALLRAQAYMLSVSRLTPTSEPLTGQSS